MPAQSALNGYFERVRRLLRLVGVSDVPDGVVPVVIVGDSREASATDQSYRVFGGSIIEVLGPTGAGNFIKFRLVQDAVITGIEVSFSGAVTSSGEIRLASKAVADADAGVAYSDFAADRGGWAHRPDPSNPPLQGAVNTGAIIGRLVRRIPRTNGIQPYPPHATSGAFFMPEGSVICITMPTASVNFVANVIGYVSRG